MGVIMQAFYWDSPKLEGKEKKWWVYLQEKAPELANDGFTALWLPPASKAANLYGNLSMGYDPFDFFDLGSEDQRDSIATLFGTKEELVNLINTAHQHDMEVYADMVLNHTSGGELETNPLTGKQAYTKYTTKTGIFNREYECYHPSSYERWDIADFGGMPDLCHRNPFVYSKMLDYAKMMIEEIGFDGFRFDNVKGFWPWMATAMLEHYYNKGNNPKYTPFAVGEYAEGEATNVSNWIKEVNAYSDAPCSAFDFPLRYRLRDLCTNYGFSLTKLKEAGTLLTNGLAKWSVTFVENHDTAHKGGELYHPIVTDKMLAYSFILTHEGYPCVFWQDYYNWNLAQVGFNSGIAALVKVHETYAGGTTSILHVDDNLYIMQRNGFENQSGLLYVLNNSNKWNGTSVVTKWKNSKLIPKAWRGKDNIDTPLPIFTNQDGNTQAWAPPRGYVVYVKS